MFFIFSCVDETKKLMVFHAACLAMGVEGRFCVCACVCAHARFLFSEPTIRDNLSALTAAVTPTRGISPYLIIVCSPLRL